MIRWLFVVYVVLFFSSVFALPPTFSTPKVVNSTRVSAASSTLNNGLIAYWKLDETSGTRADSEPTGTPNNLTDNNTVPGVAGKISNAGDFEAGNSESLSISDNADLSVGDIDFTIAAWVNSESVLSSNSDRYIASKGTTGAYEWTLSLNDSASIERFGFVVLQASQASPGIVSANTLGTPSVATWYFVVAWHDATANTINIQVDNGTVDSVAYTLGSFDSTSLFSIGSVNSTPAAFFDGLIDEVAFYKRVLTAAERTELYNAGAGKTCCPFQ